MRTFITGGAGFIGHNVIRFLEKHSVECFSVDNRTNYNFIPSDELHYLLQERLKRIRSIPLTGDIRNANDIRSRIGIFNCDTVIHLASFPRQKIVNQNASLASEVMITGLINLLEAAVVHKVKRFVYISSSMVYGDFENNVNEDAVCNPIGQYGIMKYMGEKLVEDYYRQYGLEYTIIRPSAVYGEWDIEDRVVSKFMLGAMRDETLKVNGPDEVLDFTYVEDVALGIVQALLSKNARNKIYNLTRSDQKKITLKEAAELAINIAGKGRLKILSRDLEFPKRGHLNITNAVKDFDYNPTVNVEEGFRRYHEWFKQSLFWQNKL